MAQKIPDIGELASQLLFSLIRNEAGISSLYISHKCDVSDYDEANQTRGHEAARDFRRKRLDELAERGREMAEGNPFFLDVAAAAIRFYGNAPRDSAKKAERMGYALTGFFVETLARQASQ